MFNILQIYPRKKLVCVVLLACCQLLYIVNSPRALVHAVHQSFLLPPEMPDTSGLSGLTGEQPGLLPSSSSFPTPAPPPLPSINIERCQNTRKMIFKSVTQVAQFNGLISHESPVAQYFNSTGHGISDVQVRFVAQCSATNIQRKQCEMRLIFLLGTVQPRGMNINFSFI